MRRKNRTATPRTLGSLLVFGLLTGCATTQALWGDPATGLILRYRLPEDQVLSYQSTSEVQQEMEVMGQQVAMDINSETAFTVTPREHGETGYRLGINFDSMTLKMTGPMGELSSDTSGVVGKGFEMSLSDLGKESDLSGADSLRYEIGPGESRSVESDFQAFFPDLPETPIKVGGTWTSQDTITETMDEGEVRIQAESVNTLDGFETIEGVECVKVTAAVTGTFEGEGKQRGADLEFEGTMEGTETWYFAYKEGRYVRMTSEILSEGTVVVSEPRMIIPLTRNMKVEVGLTE